MMLLDTDHLSVLQHRDSPRAMTLRERLSQIPPDDLATTAVSLEEQTRGWLARIAKLKDVRHQVPYYAGSDKESSEAPPQTDEQKEH